MKICGWIKNKYKKINERFAHEGYNIDQINVLIILLYIIKIFRCDNVDKKIKKMKILKLKRKMGVVKKQKRFSI